MIGFAAMATIPYNKWRHDLQAAITTIDHAARLLGEGPSAEPEAVAATIDSLKRVRANLDQQYLDLYALQRAKKLDD